MSTIVPNCTITYPKDLSRLYLTINAIELPNLFNSYPGDIRLTIIKDGIPTAIVDDSCLADIIPISQLTGTLDTTIISNTITGTMTLFKTELEPGDIVQLQGVYNPYFIVDSIISDTELVSTSVMSQTDSGVNYGSIRPILNIPASSIFPGETILRDGIYEVYFTYDFGGANVIANTIPFTKYVFANQYNCVEAKLMNLALYCSEGCVDMETLKNTLLLKALLDAMEISINESDTATTQLIKDKIDRYCLLLNNNCTSC